MKVMVVGGAGFVGSHVCKALAASGAEPVVFDNLSRGFEWNVKWGPLEIGDIRDHEKLKVVMWRHRPDAIIHLAAFAYVDESVSDPALYYENNIAGSLNLFRTAVETEVCDVVFSSTCAVYGAPQTCPVSENAPLRPINPYGLSKLMVERMLDHFVDDGMRAVSLRYFNASGADPDGDLREQHNPETHLIPRVIRDGHVDVYGCDYETPDGTCVRDYTHVSDLADAHVLALSALSGSHQKFNLGNGSGHSVIDVADAVSEVTGRRIERHFKARRDGDPPVLIADSAAARRCLGWQPKHASLHRIIESSL